MLVIKLLKGGSLADKLKAQKLLFNDEMLKYLKQILEGVDFLNHRNIFHSDIKPANILFNEDDHVKLCDFGIAVELQTESSASASHIVILKVIFIICLQSDSTTLHEAQQMIYGA